MRLLVFGSRTWANERVIFDYLDDLHEFETITCIVHGVAPGADLLGERWAKLRQVNYEGFPAYWNLEGRRLAGGNRNRRMVRVGRLNAAVGFRRFGPSPGTDDMVNVLRLNKIPYELIEG